jgi:hypothetical protein
VFISLIYTDSQIICYFLTQYFFQFVLQELQRKREISQNKLKKKQFKKMYFYALIIFWVWFAEDQKDILSLKTREIFFKCFSIACHKNESTLKTQVFSFLRFQIQVKSK